jgi:hypothetical protein
MREIPAFTIALVAGARPNFMKVVPVYHALAAGTEGAQGIQAGHGKKGSAPPLWDRKAG